MEVDTKHPANMKPVTGISEGSQDSTPGKTAEEFTTRPATAKSIISQPSTSEEVAKIPLSTSIHTPFVSTQNPVPEEAAEKSEVVWNSPKTPVSGRSATP